MSDASSYATGTNAKYTKGTSEWEGYGTALKPAHEPIVLARKPLSEKTIAENCLKWGVGGLNIYGCRVGTTGARNNGNSNGTIGSNSIGVYGKAIKQDYNMGRFPANLIHDGSDEVVDLFPKTLGAGNKIGTPKKAGSFFGKDEIQVNMKYDNGGSAARFFYCAKASKVERNRGCEGLEEKARPTMGNGIGGQPDQQRANNKNFHPTVKPLALMKYLVKLITREGQTVLDPFMGSGTTGIACKELGREFIGIEKETEYLEIANRRIANTQENLL